MGMTEIIEGNKLIAVFDKVFEKGICHPFQKSNNKLANYFLQKRCYKIGFEGKLKTT